MQPNKKKESVSNAVCVFDVSFPFAGLVFDVSGVSVTFYRVSELHLSCFLSFPLPARRSL